MILASQSPRRKELLSLITEDFRVIPAKGEEILPANISPSEAVILLSRQKAAEIYTEYKNELIIASDTVVAVDGEILGKPTNEQDAARMLRLLSGRSHSVFTGVCVIREDGSEVCFAEETLVEFRALSEQEIAAYIATGDPMDKAGAYGIQGRGALLVRRIDGDYYTVMGLPVCRLYETIRDTL
ncbi:MAG: septum formation protein Maf [Ruminococcaceae bacterium]|nr:septum formation protein Maf [Oscillospiraceae bacterium]